MCAIHLNLEIELQPIQVSDCRVEEYTRYLVASDYCREEVKVPMQEAREQDMEELIRRPQRKRSSGRKFALLTMWDPRAQSVEINRILKPGE